MRVLIAYASKYGSTKGIAERIAATLNRSVELATAMPAAEADHVRDYDAYVIGSAAYMYHWMKEASEFVRANALTFANKPVWLFTSGPLGTDVVDAQGRDVREAATPPEIAEFTELVRPRGHRVFFGAYDPSKLSFTHRLAVALPGIKKLMIPGDYRNWNEIDAWAKEIAHALRETSAVEREVERKRVPAPAVAVPTAAVNPVVPTAAR